MPSLNPCMTAMRCAAARSMRACASAALVSFSLAGETVSCMGVSSAGVAFPQSIVQRPSRVEGALCLHHRIQLRLAREAAGRLLGKLERAVDGDLEHAAVAFDQFDLGAGFLLQSRRRRLRARAIAAGLAEFDHDFHGFLSWRRKTIRHSLTCHRNSKPTRCEGSAKTQSFRTAEGPFLTLADSLYLRTYLRWKAIMRPPTKYIAIERMMPGAARESACHHSQCQPYRAP